LIPNENFPEALYSEDRSGPIITENPIYFYKTLVIDNNECLRGPLERTITTSQKTTMVKSLLTSIENSNKKTFNQKIDLTATFGGVTGSSSTEFGMEWAINKKSEETKSVENVISKEIKTELNIKSGKYYCILAQVKLYVYEFAGKRQYFEVPTKRLVSAEMDYDLLEDFLKEDQAFSTLRFGKQKLTTYTVKQMMDAMPAELVKKGIEKVMPEEGKYYTLSSAMFTGVVLEQWFENEQKGNEQMGCMYPLRPGKPSEWMDDRGYKTNNYQQWKFELVNKANPDIFYIINREFQTYLYVSQRNGLLSKKKPNFGIYLKDLQWKVESRPREEGGTIAIKHIQTNQYLSNWGEKDDAPFAPHYNCGPEFAYHDIRLVAQHWSRYCSYDRFEIGSSSYTTIKKFVKEQLKGSVFAQEFGSFIINLRRSSPTCRYWHTPSRSNNKVLWKLAEYFKQKTDGNPMRPEYRLWKIKEV